MGESPAAANPNGGHRERLRTRAREAGLGALPDYELLELFLFRSIPQRDVKPLAKTLLAQFGSLSAVLAATEAELVRVECLDGKGRKLKIGPETALDLRALHEATKRITLGETRAAGDLILVGAAGLCPCGAGA